MDAIEKTFTEKMIEAMALLGVVALWAFPAKYYGMLPDTIPIHFNASGEADGFGPKAFIWMLPALGTILVPGLLLLSRLPLRLNFKGKSLTGNEQRENLLASQVIRYLSLSIVTVFLIIVVTTVRVAQTGSGEHAPWLLPMILFLVLGPVIHFIFKLLKKPSDHS